MIIDIVSIPQLQFEKVHFYSVMLEGKKISEFKDFSARMGKEDRDRIELAEINRYIERIGNVYGAQPVHFRDEDAAEGLPPPYHQFLQSDEANDFGLRLYCIRLSPSVVILLNGDRKTSLKVRDCKNCFPYFDLARGLAVKITKAILEGYIEIDEETNELLIDEDFELTN